MADPSADAPSSPSDASADRSPRSSRAARSSRASWWRIDLLLALTVLLMSGLYLHPWSAQPASRYLFTAAVVDDHTFVLEPYKDSLGLDFAVIKGKTYSDKAPYQPLLAAPVYWAYRSLGGEPFPPGVQGNAVGHRADISMWLLTLVSAVLPAMALVVLLRRHVARQYPQHAVKVALALMLGTVLLPFSSELFGHMLAAAVGFGAWYVLRRPSPSALALVGAGALMGAGPGIEYPQVLVAGVLGIYCLGAFRWRAGWVVLGGVLGLLPLLIVNATIFGGPFTTAYQGYTPNFQGSGAFGVYNLVMPVPREFFLAILGDRGLFSLTPVMLMALVGCVALVRAKSAGRADAIVALVLLALFLLVSTGIDGYGGSSSGPRYLVPIVPFFAVPLAEAWRRWPGVTTFTAALSAVAMILATLTDPLYQGPGPAIVDWGRDLFAGRFESSIPGTVFGGPTILVTTAIALACAAWTIVLAQRQTEAQPHTSPREPVAP